MCRLTQRSVNARWPGWSSCALLRTVTVAEKLAVLRRWPVIFKVASTFWKRAEGPLAK
jgi:hypothetical protein